MYPIEPIQIPTQGIVDQLYVQVNNFPMRKGETYPVTVYYELKGLNAFLSGNMIVPENVTTVWADDEVIINYVASQLDVTLINETEQG